MFKTCFFESVPSCKCIGTFSYLLCNVAKVAVTVKKTAPAPTSANCASSVSLPNFACKDLGTYYCQCGLCFAVVSPAPSCLHVVFNMRASAGGRCS